MTEAAMLVISGAILLLLLAIIGWFVSDKLATLTMGIAALHTKFDNVIAEQAQLKKDCVPWEEFDKLKVDVTHINTEIAVIKTTCNAEHGKGK